MTDEEIFEQAEKYGDWDDFGRWTFRDNDGLLRFVDAVNMSQKRVDETAKRKHEWVGLTDEEVGTLTVFDGLHHVETPLLAGFARAIEAKLKEKNT
jgi:uncharacterized UPF0160 family protein